MVDENPTLSYYLEMSETVRPGSYLSALFAGLGLSEPEKFKMAAAVLGGIRSKKKTKAARKNGKKGGRPKKKK